MKTQTLLHRYLQLSGVTLLVAVLIPAALAQDVTARNGRLMQSAMRATDSTTPQRAPQQAAAVPMEPAATPTASASRAEAPTPDERYSAVHVGDVTRTLLQAQVDGRVAGPRLPMLGVTATASWQRYLDSFKHPLPENFEKKVTSNN